MIVIGVFLFLGRFEQIASLGFFFDSFDEVQAGKYILLIIGLLIVLGLIPAFIARSKGRKFYDWWFFGAALIFIALPASMLIKPKDETPKSNLPLTAEEVDLPAEG
jgi:hypothetical protein